jgi:pyridoxamine 5'-phosphate oxidase
VSRGEPAERDDLTAVLEDALDRLAEGVADRRSAFHTPTLGTIGRGDGRPRLRTVVLRGFDAAGPSLRFHTDRRSAKIEEMRVSPQVSLHVYDAAAKLQVRVEGWARLHMTDAIADAAWAASKAFSRQCYGIEPGPGAARRPRRRWRPAARTSAR